jgi:hypothetical protein
MSVKERDGAGRKRARSAGETTRRLLGDIVWGTAGIGAPIMHDRTSDLPCMGLRPALPPAKLGRGGAHFPDPTVNGIQRG